MRKLHVCGVSVALVMASFWVYGLTDGVSEAASFVRQKPRPANRSIVSQTEDGEQQVRFSGYNAQQLRRIFYESKYKSVLPNSVRDALSRHRRQILGREFPLSIGTQLSGHLLQKSILIPKSTYRFLGFANLPQIQLRILGTSIFLYNTATHQVQDVLTEFLR